MKKKIDHDAELTLGYLFAMMVEYGLFQLIPSLLTLGVFFFSIVLLSARAYHMFRKILRSQRATQCAARVLADLLELKPGEEITFADLGYFKETLTLRKL